jgi:hypothetical protein
MDHSCAESPSDGGAAEKQLNGPRDESAKFGRGRLIAISLYFRVRPTLKVTRAGADRFSSAAPAISLRGFCDRKQMTPAGGTIELIFMFWIHSHPEDKRRI